MIKEFAIAKLSHCRGSLLACAKEPLARHDASSLVGEVTPDVERQSRRGATGVALDCSSDLARAGQIRPSIR